MVFHPHEFWVLKLIIIVLNLFLLSFLNSFKLPPYLLIRSLRCTDNGNYSLQAKMSTKVSFICSLLCVTDLFEIYIYIYYHSNEATSAAVFDSSADIWPNYTNKHKHIRYLAPIWRWISATVARWFQHLTPMPSLKLKQSSSQRKSTIGWLWCMKQASQASEPSKLENITINLDNKRYSFGH